MRILREILAGFARDRVLVLADQIDPVLGGEVGVERVALAVLEGVEDFLEVMMLEAEHHVRIHGDEAAIAVIGEAAIARELRQRFHGLVVEAEIEHGVHHARHRGARAGAHGDEQRVLGVAEHLAGQLADIVERLLNLRLQFLRIGFVVGVEIGADRGRNGEARRHRQTEIGHLGEVGALAAEQVAHLRPALGLAVAERVDPFAGLGRGGGAPWQAQPSQRPWRQPSAQPPLSQPLQRASPPAWQRASQPPWRPASGRSWAAPFGPPARPSPWRKTLISLQFY